MKCLPLLALTALLGVMLMNSSIEGGDAKRDAAAKLVRDGKAADAQKLYEEIVAQNHSAWSDRRSHRRPVSIPTIAKTGVTKGGTARVFVFA